MNVFLSNKVTNQRNVAHGLGDRESLCRLAALFLQAANPDLMQFLSCIYCCPVNLSLTYTMCSELFIYCSRVFKFSMFHNGKCIQFHTILFSLQFHLHVASLFTFQSPLWKNRHFKILRTDINNPNKWSRGHKNTEN